MLQDEPLQVDKVTGLRREDDESSLTVYFLSNGIEQAICFPRNVLADLLIGIAGMQSPKSGNPIDIPAILAQRIQPFQQSDCSGLAVFLTGGWVLPIAIPPAAIPMMRQTLDDLELLAMNPSGHS